MESLGITSDRFEKKMFQPQVYTAFNSTINEQLRGNHLLTHMLRRYVIILRSKLTIPSTWT